MTGLGVYMQVSIEPFIKTHVRLDLGFSIIVDDFYQYIYIIMYIFIFYVKHFVDMRDIVLQKY